MRIPWIIALALAACDATMPATDADDGPGAHTGAPDDSDASPVSPSLPDDTDASADTDPHPDTDAPPLSDCSTVGTVWCDTGCCTVSVWTLGSPTDPPHRRSDLLVHPDGRVLVSWYQTEDRELRLSEFDGTSWTTGVAHQLPDHTNGFSHGSVNDQRLVLHAGDRPMIAFTGRSMAGAETNPTPMGFAVTAFTAAATSWSVERVYSATSSTGTLGAHRSTGGLLVFHDDNTNHVRIASRSAGLWNIDDSIQDRVFSGDGITPDVAVDSQGLRHVVWSQSASPSRVIHLRHNGATWVRTVIASADSIGVRSSLQLDDHDYPHIAWYNGTETSLNYAWADDDGWHHEEVDTGGGGWPQLLLDADGAPWIVYKHMDSNQIRLARRAGADQWVYAAVMVNLGSADHPRFDLDAHGDPWIVAYDDYNGRLRVAGSP